MYCRQEEKKNTMTDEKLMAENVVSKILYNFHFMWSFFSRTKLYILVNVKSYAFLTFGSKKKLKKYGNGETVLILFKQMPAKM